MSRTSPSERTLAQHLAEASRLLDALRCTVVGDPEAEALTRAARREVMAAFDAPNRAATDRGADLLRERFSPSSGGWA